MGKEAKTAPKGLSEILRDWVEKSAGNRASLVKRGVKNGIIQLVLNNDCPERILLVYIERIEDALGIDMRDINISLAKWELWGEGDELPQIRTHRELIEALCSLVDRHSSREVALRLGLGDKDSIRLWCANKRRPGYELVKKILMIIAADAANEWASLKTEELKPEIVALKEKYVLDTDDYSAPAIGEKLGVSHRTVLAWFSGDRRPGDETVQKIRETFPELFGGQAKTIRTPASDAKELRAAPPRAEPVGSKIRVVVRAGLTMLQSNVDMLEASVSGPGDFVDGDRATLLRLVRKLFSISGINESTVSRLFNGSLGDDGAAGEVLQALSQDKPRRR